MKSVWWIVCDEKCVMKSVWRRVRDEGCVMKSVWSRVYVRWVIRSIYLQICTYATPLSFLSNFWKTIFLSTCKFEVNECVLYIFARAKCEQPITFLFKFYLKIFVFFNSQAKCWVVLVLYNSIYVGKQIIVIENFLTFPYHHHSMYPLYTTS